SAGTRRKPGCPTRAIVQQTVAFWNPPASINLRLSAIASHRGGRKRVARSQRGPGNRVAEGRPPIRRQGRELAHPGKGARLARSTRDRDHGRKNETARFWRCFLGCNLRRSELAPLECGHIQQRDGCRVFVDLVGKEKRIPTAPIAPFVKVAIDAWTA